MKSDFTRVGFFYGRSHKGRAIRTRFNWLPEDLEGNQLRAQTNAAIPNAKLIFIRITILFPVP